MASLKAIKKRIGSVKSTQKITRAMKMVAAAKLRRAQAHAMNARHYTDAIWRLSCRLSGFAGDELHPLTAARGGVSGKKGKVGSRDYLLFTSDRGLCGGFNSNLLRRFADELSSCREQGIQPICRMVGKRGRDYFKVKNWELKEAVTGLYDKLNRGVAEELAKIATHRFEGGKTDEVWICFNYFQSAMVQKVTFQKILPLEPQPSSTTHEAKKENAIDYIYEPSRPGVLDRLLRESVAAKIYSALLESMASELAARMSAMENATNNASDMIGYLTLQYNRARQATITRELMDIVNGAEALR